MTWPRIVVTNRAHAEVVDLLSEVGDVVMNDGTAPWPAVELIARCASAAAVLAFMTDEVGPAFLSACPRLRIVACALKGYDNFDAAACSAAGVWLTIVPDLLTEPTAELAIGLAIGLGRNVRDGDVLVRAGAFDGWRPILYGAGLSGATVAVVGMGQVGQAVAARLAGFGCRLLGVDPNVPMPAGVARCELLDALAAADLVVLAAPLTDQTRHLISREAIDAMKRGALLVNVGRGSVVDEQAVIEGLETGKLGGYASDVFEFEDWALSDRPRVIDPRLRNHPRTLFTPHLGSAVARVRHAIEMRAAENILDALAGRRPRDAVNAPWHIAEAGRLRFA